MGKRNYFSAYNQEKFCPVCSKNIKLKNFRVVKKDKEYDESSRYCSVCKDCENIRAKAYQKLHYKHVSM